MISTKDIFNCLQSKPIILLGEFTWGSNATFLVELECGAGKIQAVYKPAQGEKPLWDFPAESLARREVAAYRLSEALGWGLVPPTVIREDGPAGAGSLQWRVAHDPERHYFTFVELEKRALMPTVLFDLLANNADRKGGHILLGEKGRIWLIDQGLCFHSEPKVRTVVWDFAGDLLPPNLKNDLESLAAQFADLKQSLIGLLSELEIEALEKRLHHLKGEEHFPHPPDDRRAVPYPLV